MHGRAEVVFIYKAFVAILILQKGSSRGSSGRKRGETQCPDTRHLTSFPLAMKLQLVEAAVPI